ncbi:MAG: hypothetical protein CMP41_02390 [Rickettsiales bacterium]|nr:hypothetical protein [Rickettsiales bacterium]
MSIISSLALYFIIWWICLFLFLPIDIANQSKVENGNDPGAPEQPKLKKKFLLTTIFSFFVWLLIFIFIKLANNETI